MFRSFAVVVVSVALALGACHGKSNSSSTTPPPADPVVADPKPADPPPAPAGAAAPSDAELDAMFAETVTFLDELGAAAETNAKDCKAMAKAINGVFDAHVGLLAKAKSYEGNEAVNAKADAFMEANQTRVQKASAKLGTGIQACGSDPDLQAAMKRFDEMGE